MVGVCPAALFVAGLLGFHCGAPLIVLFFVWMVLLIYHVSHYDRGWHVMFVSFAGDGW